MAVDSDRDRMFPGELLHEDGTWTEFFDDGGEPCCFCDHLVDDRRYAVGIAIRRAFGPSSVEYRFAHVECLRKTMHHQHPLR